LFLFKANDERRNGWAVQSHLPRSISLNVAAWVSSAALLAAALFLFFGEYTRLVRAEGVMLPVGGLARLTAPSSGWIKLKRVQEGDAVQAGDVRYTLCVDYITENGWVNKAGLNLLRMQRQEVSDAIERQQTLSPGSKSSSFQTNWKMRDRSRRIWDPIGHFCASSRSRWKRTRYVRRI